MDNITNNMPLNKDWNKENAASSRCQQGDYVVFDKELYANLRLVGSSFDLQNLKKFKDAYETGFVIITQTCDIQRGIEKQPFLKISPLIKGNANMINLSDKDMTLRYFRLNDQNNLFVDLDVCFTIFKEDLTHANIEPCAFNKALANRFRHFLARHGTRYAFPNEVHTATTELRTFIKKNLKKGTSLSRRLDEINDIRVEGLPSWEDDPLRLRLSFIISSSALKPLEDCEALTEEEQQKYDCSKKSIEEVAKELEDKILPDSVRRYLWECLIEKVVREKTACPEGQGEMEMNISGIEHYIASAGELTVEDYWATESLEYSELR